MKIAFYRHSLLNRGGDKMVVQYANYLASQGHDVTLLVNITKTLFLIKANVKNISSWKSKIGTIVKAISSKYNEDVIIVDIIAMAFFLSFRNRKKVIYFSQDYDVSYYSNPLLRVVIRACYWLCLNVLAIPTIAVSYELGNKLTTKFDAEVQVVQNGVDTEYFYPEKTDEYLKLKGESSVILLFSRSDYRKGFDIAIETIKQLSDKIKNGEVKIWSVGETIAVPFPLCHFGFVQPDALRRILSCSDVLLYPSRHEGLPLFVLEAMACGCAIVTTKAVTFVSDGKDALQASIGDSVSLAAYLGDLLRDQSRRKKLASAALRTVEKMNINESCKKFEVVLLNCYKNSLININP